jgi:hypothetical protein
MADTGLSSVSLYIALQHEALSKRRERFPLKVEDPARASINLLSNSRGALF